MKKILIVGAILIAMLGVANAQVMKQGENIVSFGIGVPNVAGNNIKLPAFIGVFDHGFTNKLGIGYISGGAQLSLSAGGWDSYYYEYKTTYLVFGPRAAYHFDFKDITGNSAFDKLDIYAGAMAGFSIEPYKTKVKYDGSKTSSTNVYFANDVFVGIRYGFSSNMMVYAEAGYGIAYISAGLAFKL